MPKGPYDIVIFLIVVSALILCMVAFIVFMAWSYRRRQHQFEQSLEQTKLDHEKNLLNTRLEVQEQTFQHISREIHDNINLSLTLAKLNLNTLDWKNKEKATIKVDSSIELLTQSIAQLSDISKGLNADIIIQHGLLPALEDELNRIRQATGLIINYSITGEPVYMDNQQELIIFRIVQEAFNNIIKHARTHRADFKLHFNTVKLIISISDTGIGFDPSISGLKRRAGLMNMGGRVKMLNGTMQVNSQPGHGTTLNFTIPFSIT